MICISQFLVAMVTRFSWQTKDISITPLSCCNVFLLIPNIAYKV